MKIYEMSVNSKQSSLKTTSNGFRQRYLLRLNTAAAKTRVVSVRDSSEPQADY